MRRFLLCSKAGVGQGFTTEFLQRVKNSRVMILSGKWLLNKFFFLSHSYNKGRFCNTIASVALVHTSIQSD